MSELPGERIILVYTSSVGSYPQNTVLVFIQTDNRFFTESVGIVYCDIFIGFYISFFDSEYTASDTPSP